MSHRIDRRHYAGIYGPTTGDRVRLGDTGLVAEVEQDATVYGDECKFGGGKVLRDGMGQAAGISDDRELAIVHREIDEHAVAVARVVHAEPAKDFLSAAERLARALASAAP